MSSQPNRADRLYALVANEEDARACKDISDRACREVPKNFFLILGSLVLTKLGDLLISPKTVLAWLMGAVGAPSALVAWLVPIRESGSMLPQLAIGAWVRNHEQRAGFWVLGSVLQGICVMGMALAVWLLQGMPAGLAILGLLILFSLSRGLCSVAMKDVQGKCIPKARRGRLTGLASTFAGTITAILALLLFHDRDPDKLFYTLLLIAGGALWLAAAALFANVEEDPGESGGGENALRQAWASLSLLRDDAPFRHFVITRALLLCSALSAPFFVLLAQQANPDALLLGAFLLSSALASSLSATIWGYMADRSSRQVMILAAALSSAISLIVGVGAWWLESLESLFWLIPVAYFILSVAHAGVRVGRKTYLVDMAGGNKRTDYVSVSNTVIGMLLLVIGGISAAASIVSLEAAIILLGMMGAAGAISAISLREVEQDG